MAAPEQRPEGGAEEIAKLFQNVGQGLVLITQYVSQVAPQAQGMAEQLMQGYQQLVDQVQQARQGGGEQRPPQASPAPAEAGAANARPM